MDAASTFDLLIVSRDPTAQAALADAFKARGNARISAHGTARLALESFIRARGQFDAIVCERTLDDCDCWRFLRMVRSGRFGFAYTRAYILVEEEEREALAPLADAYTTILVSTSPDDVAEQIGARRDRLDLPSLLLVEDERDAAAAAERALAKHFAVEVCYDGESALAAWRARPYSIVVLDLMLPGLTGAQVQREMVSVRPTQPIVILTADGTQERHQELMLSGATEFLVKPYDLAQLPMLCLAILHEQACLESAKQALGAASQLHKISEHIHAADYTLSTGRTGEAALHVRRAAQITRLKSLSDDQWTALRQEYNHPTES